MDDNFGEWVESMGVASGRAYLLCSFLKCFFVSCIFRSDSQFCGLSLSVQLFLYLIWSLKSIYKYKATFQRSYSRTSVHAMEVAYYKHI